MAINATMDLCAKGAVIHQMSIKRNKPFEKQYLDEENKKQDVCNVWIQKGNRDKLEDIKYLLEQTRDSTTINQLIEISHEILIGDQKTNKILRCVFKNKRNNKRLGIAEFE